MKWEGLKLALEWRLHEAFPGLKSLSFAKVVRRPSGPPTVETDLRVEEVGANAADAFAAVNVAAWEVPPAFSGWFGGTLGRRDWHHWLAYDGDLPVSTGALFARGGVGWLGFGATLPSHRGRGGQGAIMAARIRKAAELGCSIVHTETDEETAAQPNPSYRNMLRTGFEVAYRRPNYLSAAVGE